MQDFGEIDQKIFFYPNEALACIAVSIIPQPDEVERLIVLRLEQPSKGAKIG